MQTLLKLFFVPYLRFLAKFHLYAVGATALVFLLKVQELMMALPLLYFFALYTTSNRHQFKDNISWMLSSFNKKTLITYHLMAQSFVLLIQLVLMTLGTVTFIALTAFVAPEISDQVMPDMPASAARSGAGSLLMQGLSPLATSKEFLVTLAAIFFFLITMYSPVSLKDYLKSVEERGKKYSMQQRLLLALAWVVGCVSIFYFQPSQWLIPLLSFILIGELGYLVWMFNRAFTLFHHRIYPKTLAAGAVVTLLLSVGVYRYSLNQFNQNSSPEVRLAELNFMGALAPHVSPEEFTAIAMQIKDPRVVAEMISDPRFGHLIPMTEIERWVLEAKELGVALRLIEALPVQKLAWLAKDEQWAGLEKLFAELHTRNQASAAWQARRLEKHLMSKKFVPRARAMKDRGPLEQYVVMNWWRRFEPIELTKIDQSQINPMVGTLLHGDFSAQRKPASGR